MEGVYKGEDVFVDHPQSRYEKYPFLMAPHVFGIERKEPELHNSSKVFIPYNSDETWPVESNRTAVASASLVALYFQAPLPDDFSTNIITEWEEEVFLWSQLAQRVFSDLRIDVMGDKVLGREMTRGGLSLLPHLIAGISLTVVFVAAMVVYNAVRVGRMDCGLIIIVLGQLCLLLSPNRKHRCHPVPPSGRLLNFWSDRLPGD